jgi:hypothetical protein
MWYDEIKKPSASFAALIAVLYNTMSSFLPFRILLHPFVTERMTSLYSIFKHGGFRGVQMFYMDNGKHL